jgi:hypothetical protein
MDVRFRAIARERERRFLGRFRQNKQAYITGEPSFGCVALTLARPMVRPHSVALACAWDGSRAAQLRSGAVRYPDQADPEDYCPKIKRVTPYFRLW